MACKVCGGTHESRLHYKVLDKLHESKYPTGVKAYKSAHEAADKLEKKKFGTKSYRKLQEIANKMQNTELEGKNLRSGKIEISKKVPKKYRDEVAFHEKVESKILRRKK